MGQISKNFLTGLIGLMLCGANTAMAADMLRVASTNKEVFDNVPFFVAQDLGLFQKNAIEIELTHFRGGGEVVRAISANAADIGMVAASAAIIAAGKGEPLRIFSAWSAPAYGIAMVVPPESPLRSVRDLEGKKVGITRPGSVSHTALVAALQSVRLQDKVEIVPLGSYADSWTAFKAARVHVTWYPAPDVFSLVERGEARILGEISDYMKDYQQGAMVALETTLAKRGETIKRFLKAIAEANAMIDSDPAGAARITAKHTGLAEPMIKKTIDAMPKGFFTVGAPTTANFVGAASEAVGTGALKQPPDYDTIVTRQFLP